MDELLKRELCCNTLKLIGTSPDLCNNTRKSYETERSKVFAKHNTGAVEAKLTFDGECASLEAIRSTSTVRVPKPIKIFPDDSGSGWVFVMEHLDMTALDKHQATLGVQLAKLHVYNQLLKAPQGDKQSASDSSMPRYISKFGFHCPTFCGLIPMLNHWEESWVEFYVSKRLEPQMSLILKKCGGESKEATVLWEKLKPKIPSFFVGVHIEPSLLHGDLWAGNAGETNDGPVIFDPGSFYGHHEFDLAITHMFGGFNEKFYDAYHKLIPKSPGFSDRQKLYMLFHYLNHWNHFGSSYRSQSISLLRELSK